MVLFTICGLGQAQQLPEGVRLPPGVELPEDFALPEGLVIPEGFEITEEMIKQYLKYMETQESGGLDTSGEDAWFKQLGNNHPTADLQDNLEQAEEAAANESSTYTNKFMDTFMSKEIVLPTLTMAVALILVWAIATKCGKRRCCK